MYLPREPYDKDKKKHEIKYAFKVGIEFKLHMFQELFNVNMIVDGLGKFLKYLEDL